MGCNNSVLLKGKLIKKNMIKELYDDKIIVKKSKNGYSIYYFSDDIKQQCYYIFNTLENNNAHIGVYNSVIYGINSYVSKQAYSTMLGFAVQCTFDEKHNLVQYH